MDWYVSVCVCVYEVIGDKLENRNLQRETMETMLFIWKNVLEKRETKHPSKPIHAELTSLYILLHFRELSFLCVNDEMWEVVKKQKIPK